MQEKNIKCGFEQEGFWENLGHKKIIKYRANGKYNRSFDEEYLNLLNSIHNLDLIEELKIGNIIKGVIEKITKKEIVININYKDSVFVDNKTADLKIIENLKIGDEIDVVITDIQESPYQIKGSISELIKMKVSNKLKESYTGDVAILAKVTEIIPAGFMLDIEMDNITINAFMPNTLAGVNKLTEEQCKDMLGQKMHVMLESLQQEKGVYVVSRKKYLQTLIPEEIKKLKKNTIYTGVVTGTKDFGVFVEFGVDKDSPQCLTGMIHKVNMNPAYQENISSIPAGSTVEFYIRDILKGCKIVLTQILRESLWDTIKVGQIRDAKVLGIKNNGILVSLDDETFGLIQNAYIQKNTINFNIGETIKVKVVSVIKNDRKIYLSLPDKN